MKLHGDQEYCVDHPAQGHLAWTVEVALES